MFNNRKMGSSDSLLDTIKGIMEKKHTTPETPKEKSLAKLAHPKDKITHKDVLVGRGVLKKENSGDRMGVIVGTRKEKVELEPKLKEGKQVDERKLTGAETEKKEKYVMALKKKAGGFKQRYGARAKEVMYATATKMAKEEAAPVNELEKKKYVDVMYKASEPSYGSGNTERIAKKAEKEHGAKFAKQLAGVAASHFPRPHHSMGHDPFKYAKSPRVTKAGKLNKQDAGAKKAEIKARLGGHTKPKLPEGK